MKPLGEFSPEMLETTTGKVKAKIHTGFEYTVVYCTKEQAKELERFLIFPSQWWFDCHT